MFQLPAHFASFSLAFALPLRLATRVIQCPMRVEKAAVIFDNVPHFLSALERFD